jgi:phosphoribosylanthranilate isomerase
MVRPDIVQFHGTETPEWLNLVRQHTKAHIWKAIGLKNRETLINADRFDDVVDRVLYDAPAQALPGGTGTRVDWSLLSQFRASHPLGIGRRLSTRQCRGSVAHDQGTAGRCFFGVESAPGVKDVDKIAAFCKAVRDL